MELLVHPNVGGVIYFSRNYDNPQQLLALSQSIKAINPDLLLAVDHEGGRVRRFLDGFTQLPAVATIGKLWQQDAKLACVRAAQHGFIFSA